MRIDKYSMAKGWMMQEDATPEEAKATWDTLETEFEDKRKSWLMASAETDEIIKTINDKFGPGTMFPASQASQPPMTDQQAIFEWEERNKKAGGGRIGFKKGLSVDVYNTVYDEYVDLVETGFKNNKLIDTPTWESFVKSKGHSSPSLMYYADKPAPTKLLREKKLELAKKLIDAENLKLDGKWKMHKDGASSIFQGKIFNNRLDQKPGTIEGDVGRLVNEYLDTKDDKIKRAFNYIMNPEYKMTASGETGVAHEIQRLIAPNTAKGRITKDIRKTLEAIPEYKKIEDKLKYINRIITKVPKGTDMSMGYLMEMAENNKLGRANFEDWWKLAGDKPEQFAMREVVRNWNNSQGKGDFKLYDLNGKEITWKGKDTKLNTDKLLFSYADEGDLGYKNKLYTFFKPDKETLAKINKTVPNEGVFDLKGNIRKLDEFNELVEVVDGRNKLFNTEMIDPFTGEKSTYKKVYENIYKKINTTAYGTKEGYSKVKAMAGHIDHDFGTKKYPFNNLRISTGQQNLMFKALVDAAENNKALEPYVRALEAEMYTGGSIDNQIKAIVNETNELGKVVKNAPGKITIPTATETAAFKFLKNEIPDLPESVIKYLQPKAAVAEKIFKETPDLEKVYQRQSINELTGGDPKLNKFVSQNFMPSGPAGAFEMLSDDLKKIVNSEGFKTWKAKIANPALTAAGKAARLPTKIFGVADLALGYLDYSNNRQKGWSKEDSIAHMTDTLLFGITNKGEKADMAGVKKIAMEKYNMSSEVFDQLIESNKNQNEVKQIITDFAKLNKDTEERIKSGFADESTENLILLQNKDKGQKRLQVLMAEAIEREPSLKTNLQVQEAGAPIDINVDKGKALADLSKSSYDFVQKRIEDSDLEKIASQKDTTKGVIGDKVSSVFQWDIFNLLRGQPTEAMKHPYEMEKLKKEDPALYYKMLLSEGVDPRMDMNLPVHLEWEQKYPYYGTPISDEIKKSTSYFDGGIASLRRKK